MSNFNFGEEIKNIFVTIKDLVIKLISTVATILFMIDFSNDNNIEDRTKMSIGSCFHPRTLIKLKDGRFVQMQDVSLGAELEDGGKVFAVLKIDNLRKEPLYKIKNCENNQYIYVTGEHYIYDNQQSKWIKVKNFIDAEIQHEIASDWFSCLITTNHCIKIGNYKFWDWEDDELNKV
jgi:hypothetical protein